MCKTSEYNANQKILEVSVQHAIIAKDMSRYIQMFKIYLTALPEQQCLQKAILALDVANTPAFITTSQHLALFLSPQEMSVNVWGFYAFYFTGNFLLLTTM